MLRAQAKQCAFSCSEPMCLTLDKAGVPRDDKWRSLVMYMRGINHHDYLTTKQRAQLQLLVLNVMKEKNYSNDKFREVIRQSDKIFSAPYAEKVQASVEASQKLLDEFQGTLRKRRTDIQALEVDAVEAIASGQEPHEIISHLRNTFKDLIHAMDEDVERLDRLCKIDELTGLHNRRSFDEYLERAILSTAKEGKPIALFFADIDHFKKFNEQYGRQVGDQALAAIAKIIERCLKDHGRRKRKSGAPMAARYGGEEFAIVVPGMEAGEAGYLAEEIREAIEDYHFLIRNERGEVVQKGITLTTSIGVADLAAYQSWSNAIMTLIEKADVALYKAKSAGRNRVCISDNDGLCAESKMAS